MEEKEAWCVVLISQDRMVFEKDRGCHDFFYSGKIAAQIMV